MNLLDFQRRRFDREARAYDESHNDPLSQLYRDRFIRAPLFDVELEGKRVLDAMAASGPETGFLIGRGAAVTGLDISPENARLYEERWDRRCVVRSIHDTGFPDASFDLVYVNQGLHHVLPLLGEAVREIHRITRPGGHFCFVEPSRDTWLDSLRALWYRLDRRFHESESAVSYERSLKPLLDLGFEEELVFEGGSFAYLFIAHAHITRVPSWLRRIAYRPLFALEGPTARGPAGTKLFFAGRWRKAARSNSGNRD